MGQYGNMFSHTAHLPYCPTAVSRTWQKRPASRDPFDGAVRLTNHGPRIERPSATNHGIAPLELEQIFSSRCHAEQAEGRSLPQRSRTGSNRRPPACKAGALPAELRPPKVSAKPKPEMRQAACEARRREHCRHPKTQPAALDVGLRPRLPRRRRRPRSAALSWWAWEDLNLRPHAYQARALTN